MLVDNVSDAGTLTEDAGLSDPAASGFAETMDSASQVVTPSVKYSAGDSLTVEVFDAAKNDWVGIDTKGGGEGASGVGNLAPLESMGSPQDIQVRLRNNSTGQVIPMDSDQARITDRADGSRVIHFEDRRNGDKDFNDAVVTLAGPGGTTPTEPPTEAGFSFDSTKLVALLEALNKMTELVQSNDMPEHLLDKTIDVIENVTTALTAESEEGGNYSLDEITGLLSEVSSLQQEFEDTAADSDEEQEVLNALIDGTDVIVAALDSQNV